MPVPTRTISRAPPIEAVLKVPPDPPRRDDGPAQRRAALWTGSAAGMLWAGVLLGVLLGLGRVPWPESLLWSGVSGLIVGRSTQLTTRRFLHWALASTSIELGMHDPQSLRRRLPRALARYGYQEARHTLQADRYIPRRLPALLPPVRVAWSGPGAIIDGPRWLVRIAARLAVG